MSHVSVRFYLRLQPYYDGVQFLTVIDLPRSFGGGDLGSHPYTGVVVELKSEDQRFCYSYIKITKFGSSTPVTVLWGSFPSEVRSDKTPGIRTTLGGHFVDMEGLVCQTEREEDPGKSDTSTGGVGLGTCRLG